MLLWYAILQFCDTQRDYLIYQHIISVSIIWSSANTEPCTNLYFSNLWPDKKCYKSRWACALMVLYNRRMNCEVWTRLRFCEDLSVAWPQVVCQYLIAVGDLTAQYVLLPLTLPLKYFFCQGKSLASLNKVGGDWLEPHDWDDGVFVRQLGPVKCISLSLSLLPLTTRALMQRWVISCVLKQWLHYNINKLLASTTIIVHYYSDIFPCIWQYICLNFLDYLYELFHLAEVTNVRNKLYSLINLSYLYIYLYQAALPLIEELSRQVFNIHTHIHLQSFTSLPLGL